MPFAAPPPPPVPPAAAPVANVAQTADPDAARPSLEELLRAARQERDTQLAGLRPIVAELMGRLEKLGPKGRKRDLRELRETLAGLDPACAQLLVPWLDPGEDTPAKAVFRAEEARRALQPIASLAAVPALAELSRAGSTLGRENALAVLGHTPPSSEAKRALAGALGDDASRIRLAAALALGRHADPAAEALLATALRDPSAQVSAVALEGLALRPGTASASAVLAFARDRDRSAAQLSGLVAYYANRSDAIGDLELDALLALLRDGRVPAGDKIELLGLLADVKLMTRTERRRALDSSVGAANGDLRDAARVCQALLGDRTARKVLIAPYDEAVSDRPRNYRVYVDRGSLFVRLRTYDRAARDFKKALDQEIENEQVKRELNVLLARAYAKDGKLGKAADALEDAWLSRRELRELARDPDFAALASNSRHGKILRPD